MRQRLVRASVAAESSKCAVAILNSEKPFFTKKATCDADEERLRTNGIFDAPLTKLYNKAETPLKKALILRTFDGSIRCGDFWAESGYAVDPVCPECGEEIDSAFHRTFVCKCFKEQRAELIPEALVKQALEAGEKSLLFSRGIVGRPNMCEIPTECVLYYFGPDGREVPPFKFDCFFETLFAGDGSCIHGTNVLLARASFAIVACDLSGSLIKGVYGTVPTTMPQSSASGELCAAICMCDTIDHVAFAQQVVPPFNRTPFYPGLYGGCNRSGSADQFFKP